MILKTRRTFIKTGGLALAALAFPIPLLSLKKYKTMDDNSNFDVIIIGGSYAGLSAAMTLGRSLRNVLIIDAGDPCNRQTPHSHNFITHDGATPAVISQKAKIQVLKYPTVQFIQDYALSASKTKLGFEVFTKSGLVIKGRKIIFATGIKDVFPKIEGFAECWGISVIHCPYCHGYEVRKVKTGILANGDGAFETAKLISNWTDDLTIFTNGRSELTQNQAEELRQKNISVNELAIGRIEHTDGYITGLHFNNGDFVPLKALYARVPFIQKSEIPAQLGCDINEQGYLKVDMFQKTSISGVYACGDNTTFIRSVAQAVHAGGVSGSAANMEMIQEDWAADLR
jgi:thioredoxin reductase